MPVFEGVPSLPIYDRDGGGGGGGGDDDDDVR